MAVARRFVGHHKTKTKVQTITNTLWQAVSKLIDHEKSSTNKRKDFEKSIHEMTEPENGSINAYIINFILPYRYALGSVFAAATAQVSALYPTNSPLAEYPPAFVYTPAN